MVAEKKTEHQNRQVNSGSSNSNNCSSNQVRLTGGRNFGRWVYKAQLESFPRVHYCSLLLFSLSDTLSVPSIVSCIRLSSENIYLESKLFQTSLITANTNEQRAQTCTAHTHTYRSRKTVSSTHRRRRYVNQTVSLLAPSYRLTKKWCDCKVQLCELFHWNTPVLQCRSDTRCSVDCVRDCAPDSVIQHTGQQQQLWPISNDDLQLVKSVISPGDRLQCQRCDWGPSQRQKQQWWKQWGKVLMMQQSKQTRSARRPDINATLWHECILIKVVASAFTGHQQLICNHKQREPGRDCSARLGLLIRSVRQSVSCWTASAELFILLTHLAICFHSHFAVFKSHWQIALAHLPIVLHQSPNQSPTAQSVSQLVCLTVSVFSFFFSLSAHRRVTRLLHCTAYKHTNSPQSAIWLPSLLHCIFYYRSLPFAPFVLWSLSSASFKVHQIFAIVIIIIVDEKKDDCPQSATAATFSPTDHVCQCGSLSPCRPSRPVGFQHGHRFGDGTGEQEGGTNLVILFTMLHLPKFSRLTPLTVHRKAMPALPQRLHLQRQAMACQWLAQVQAKWPLYQHLRLARHR